MNSPSPTVQPKLFVIDTVPLPTRAEADAARDEAIKRAEDHAKERWLKIAEDTVLATASELVKFSADDVWARLHALPFADKTHDPRALGAVMRKLAKSGAIRATGGYVKSVRRHSTPIVEWTATGLRMDVAA